MTGYGYTSQPTQPQARGLMTAAFAPVADVCARTSSAWSGQPVHVEAAEGIRLFDGNAKRNLNAVPGGPEVSLGI